MQKIKDKNNMETINRQKKIKMSALKNEEKRENIWVIIEERRQIYKSISKKAELNKIRKKKFIWNWEKE